MSGLFGTLPVQISVHDQIACVKREIAMRERVYPRWIVAKKITPEKADHEIACMKAVLESLLEKRSA